MLSDSCMITPQCRLSGDKWPDDFYPVKNSNFVNLIMETVRC